MWHMIGQNGEIFVWDGIATSLDDAVPIAHAAEAPDYPPAGVGQPEDHGCPPAKSDFP